MGAIVLNYSWLGWNHTSKDALKARSLSPDTFFDDESMWKKCHWNLKQTTRAGKMCGYVRGRVLGQK